MRSKDSCPVLRGLGDSNASRLPGRYTLIHDPDKAGLEWCETVSGAIRHATSDVRIVSTPGTLDPDEAILGGWWPDGL